MTICTKLQYVFIPLSFLAVSTGLSSTVKAETKHEAHERHEQEERAERKQRREEGGAPSGIYHEILVTGGLENIKTTTGSATLLDKQVIEQFDSTDVNSLLSKVPGVYIRQEDGFGLRPNIGLRGTNSDRSSKITLMEDGILITPAPYSAPAAYYVPNVNRMSAVEVFKGPSVIQHGPHTVGGAINFVSRPIPEEREGELGLSLGSFGYQKLNGFYGDSFEQFGFWVDGLTYQSDGFKELDDGAGTGFQRNDINLKAQWNSKATATIYQEFQVKLGYADEEADESYLGLTDQDFAVNPLRRYPASQLDSFTSEHQQIQLLYSADFWNEWKLTGRAYQHDFERSWNKFVGIWDGEVSASEILVDSLDIVAQLRGTDSLGEGDQIDVTDNFREYRSTGIQLNLETTVIMGRWSHELTTGFRAHNDYVERDHFARGYYMANSKLALNNQAQRQKSLNKGEVDALAVFIEDNIEFGDYTFNIGVRYEDIKSEFEELAPGKEAEATGFQTAVLPSAGIHYQLNSAFGLLAGVNYGFSPAAATADVWIEPEVSVNYEYGFRFDVGALEGEVIGYLSDYKNLISRCRSSEACAGSEFNAGESEIKGVELSTHYRVKLGSGWAIPMSFVYTYTDGRFNESFESDFSQWGSVRAGDNMPYIPPHQANIQAGISNDSLTFNLALKYVDKMKEAAGTGVALEGVETDPLTTVDLSLMFDVNDQFALQLIVENVSNQQKIVSRRPYGARPNAPRIIKAGISYHF